MADEAYTPIPDEEEPLIQTRPRTRRIRYAVGAASLMLAAATAARAEKRPYVIVFVGVNGVGKSTSLSKVCYYLQQKKLNVLIAACDTFRSGAVEQLKTHAFIPCGHHRCCKYCALKQEKRPCPWCRVFVTKAVKIFD